MWDLFIRLSFCPPFLFLCFVYGKEVVSRFARCPSGGDSEVLKLKLLGLGRGGDREQASSFPVLLMFPCFFFGFVLDGPFCVIVPIQSVIACCWLRQQGHRRFKRFLGVFCTGRSAALHGCLAALQGPLSCSFGSCVGVKARGEEFALSL